MAFQSVSDYVTEIQALSQDTDGTRYSQARYIAALNSGLAEGYRLRPDFFRGLSAPPAYTIGDMPTTVNWPASYALSLILYCTGHLELTDAQGNEDSRAAALMTAFVQKLTKAAT